MKHSPRRWILLAVGTMVSAFLLYLSLRKINYGDLRLHIAAVSLSILSLGLVVRFINFCLVSVRSSLLFAPLHRYSLWFLFKSNLLSFAVNNVIPFRAGEVARIGYLSQRAGVPATSCLAVVAVERLLDVLAIFVIIVCALPAMAVDLPIGAPFYLAGVVVLSALGGTIWISQRPNQFVRLVCWFAGLLGASVRRLVASKATSFADGLSALKSPLTVVLVMAISLTFWVLGCLSVQIWIWAFGYSLPWYAPVIVVSFLTFGLAIPSTPGHIGTFHFFAASAMMAAGLPEAESVSIAIVGHAMAVVPYTLLAVPILFSDFTRTSKAHVTPSP